MGQSINVLLYGARVPDGINDEDFIKRWEAHVAPKIEALAARIRGSYSDSLARQAYVPQSPCPDDAAPDLLIGFYVCCGYYDHAESHQRFANMTSGALRRAKAMKRCRRRWARFARWARSQGVELGKARIWRTRTEVA